MESKTNTQLNLDDLVDLQAKAKLAPRRNVPAEIMGNLVDGLLVLSPTGKERFWSKIGLLTKECWWWRGRKSKLGYGTIDLKLVVPELVECKSNNYFAHRISHMMFIGLPTAEKPCVLHTCDNPSCVNPNHLWLGTRDDNNKDRNKKGRYGSMRGERNPNVKLNLKQVLMIRNLYRNGNRLASLGRQFEVTTQAIYRIVTRRTWK